MIIQISEELYATVDDFGDVMLSEFEMMDSPVITISSDDVEIVASFLDDVSRKNVDMYSVDSEFLEGLEDGV